MHALNTRALVCVRVCVRIINLGYKTQQQTGQREHVRASGRMRDNNKTQTGAGFESEKSQKDRLLMNLHKRIF